MFTYTGSAVAIVDIKRTQEAWWKEQYGEPEPDCPHGQFGATVRRASRSLSDLIRHRLRAHGTVPVGSGD